MRQEQEPRRTWKVSPVRLMQAPGKGQLLMPASWQAGRMQSQAMLQGLRLAQPQCPLTAVVRPGAESLSPPSGAALRRPSGAQKDAPRQAH